MRVGAGGSGHPARPRVPGERSACASVRESPRGASWRDAGAGSPNDYFPPRGRKYLAIKVIKSAGHRPALLPPTLRWHRLSGRGCGRLGRAGPGTPPIPWQGKGIFLLSRAWDEPQGCVGLWEGVLGKEAPALLRVASKEPPARPAMHLALLGDARCPDIFGVECVLVWVFIPLW